MVSLVRRTAVALLVVFTIQARAGENRPLSPQLGMLDEHRHNVNETNKWFQDVFGPAPALASTPYFALAVITGAALLVDHPSIAQSDSPFVQRLRTNAIIRQAKNYASWGLFAVLLLLAFTTLLANSGKVQGTVGKFARAAENVAVGTAYLAVMGMTLTGSAPTSTVAQQPTMMVAGFLPPASDLGRAAMFVTAGIALAAMFVVRFAFDVLIWLIPIPLIDLLFEGLKKTFSVLFLILYLVSPIIASILALIILVPCLLLLPWALRLLGFARRIIILPLLVRFAGVRRPPLIDPLIAKQGRTVLACRGIVLKARGFKKRQGISLVQTGGHTTVMPLRGSRKARGLLGTGEHVVIGKGLAWIEVRVIDDDERVLDQIALPYSLLHEYGTLCMVLSARDAGHLGLRKALATAGQKAREGVDAASRSVERLRTTL